MCACEAAALDPRGAGRGAWARRLRQPPAAAAAHLSRPGQSSQTPAAPGTAAGPAAPPAAGPTGRPPGAPQGRPPAGVQVLLPRAARPLLAGCWQAARPGCCWLLALALRACCCWRCWRGPAAVGWRRGRARLLLWGRALLRRLMRLRLRQPPSQLQQRAQPKQRWQLPLVAVQTWPWPPSPAALAAPGRQRHRRRRPAPTNDPPTNDDLAPCREKAGSRGGGPRDHRHVLAHSMHECSQAGAAAGFLVHGPAPRRAHLRV